MKMPLEPVVFEENVLLTRFFIQSHFQTSAIYGIIFTLFPCL